MTQHNRFVIRNESSKPLILNIEPEGAHFELRKGDEVLVSDDFTSVPVTIKVSDSESVVPVVSIWPGDGDVIVQKDGVDVLDLIQEEVPA